MLEKMWSKGNTPLLLVEVQICTVVLEIHMAVSWKNGDQSFSRPSYTNFGNMAKGYTIIQQRCLLNYFHSSIIHNSYNLKTT